MKIKRIPQRVILAFVGFLGVVNSYLLRVFFSVVILRMAPKKKQYTAAFTEKFEWSEKTQSLIQSAFYIGYVLGHIPGAILAERYGGKIILNLGLLSTAICTLVTPFVVQAGGSDALIVLRFLMGIGEAPVFPALGSMLSAWFPPKERGILASFVFGGVQMGSILAHLISAAIMKYTEGYGYIFFIYGGVGVAWNILFHFTAYDRPEIHPRVTDEEKEYLKNEIGEMPETRSFFNLPWFSLLTSGPVWALIIAQFGHDWGLFFLISNIPKYFRNVLNMSETDAALNGTMPYILSWILSILAGALATVLPSVFVVGGSYARYDKAAVVALFTLAVGSMGCYYAGNRVNVLDICPNYTASLLGLVNGLGAIAGIIAINVGGKLTPNQTLLEWRNAYWITFGVLVGSTIVYLIWASGEQQSWNNNTNEDNWLRRLYTRYSHQKVDKIPSDIEEIENQDAKLAKANKTADTTDTGPPT